jgi:hypothetical protein
VYSGEQVDLSNFQTTVFKQNRENNIFIGATVLKNAGLRVPQESGVATDFLLKEIVFELKISDSSPEKPTAICLEVCLSNVDATTIGGRELDELPLKTGTMLMNLSATESGKMSLESWETEGLAGLLGSLGCENVSDERTENLHAAFGQWNRDIESSEKDFPPEEEYSTPSNLRFAYASENGDLRKGELIPTRVSYPGGATGHQVLIRRFFQDLMSRVNRILVSELESVTYCGPIRQISSISVNASQFAGRLLPDGSNVQAVLASLDEKALELLSESLQRISERYYSLERINRGEGSGIPQDAGFTQTFLRDNFTGALVAFKDAGAGIAQVLPILIGLAALSQENRSRRNPNRGDGLLIVEQPELHLHPQLQGELADVAVNSVNGNFRDHELGPVVVLETHSEAILLRVLRRIREGIIDPKKVAFYFVDRLPGSDSSYVDRMEINSDGEFTRPWPLSFSELRISER